MTITFDRISVDEIPERKRNVGEFRASLVEALRGAPLGEAVLVPLQGSAGNTRSWQTVIRGDFPGFIVHTSQKTVEKYNAVAFWLEPREG